VSSRKQQCKVPQNSCSRAGTGPGCSGDSIIGGLHKKTCLDEAKEYCEKGLTDCIAKCDEDKETNMKEKMGGASSLVQGTYSPEGVKGSTSGNSYTATESIVGAEPYGLGDSSLIRGPSDTGGMDLHAVWAIHATCMRDCYYDIIPYCETVQCYCPNLKCDAGSKNSSGTGSGGDVENFDYKYETDQLNGVEFDTTSQYGGLIELVYTRSYMPGNVIWISDVETTRTDNVYTITDRDTNTVTVRTAISVSNTVDMHIGLCAGVTSDILSIRVNGAIYYDRGDTAYTSIADTFELMSGSESQRVRQVIAEEYGFGRAPAYRGLSYLVLGDFQLSGLTQFPKFSIEVAKSVSRTAAYQEGEALPGKDSSTVWSVVPESRRIYAESSTGVMCVDADTLAPRWDVPVTDPIEVTPLGKILTYDGSRIEVVDSPFEESYGGYTASLPISQSFLFRTPDMTGNSSLSLFAQDGAGNTIAEEIVEGIPVFPTDAVAIRDLSGFDSAPHDAAVDVYNYTPQASGISSLQRSLFFARITPGAFDTVRMRELRMIGALSDRLLEREEWYEYDLVPLNFGNVNTLAILGLVPKKDGSIIIFTGSNSGYLATCWNAQQGVVWRTVLPVCPYFGKYSPVDTLLDTAFFFLSGTTVRRLDVETGALSTWTLPSTPPTLDGKQFYVSRRKEIIYESAGNKLARISLEQFTTNKETVGDVARDLTERLGLSPGDFDYTDIDTIEITGFRSGTNETAAAILRSLADIYQFTFSAEDRLTFISKTTDTALVVNPDDVINTALRTRTIVNKEDKSVRVSYFSVELLGEQAEQSFTLDQDAERIIAGSETTYSWPVLEDALFMRRVAERLATGGTTQTSGTNLAIPPRYLYVTPGDTLANGERLQRVTIGADLTIEFAALSDTPQKYGEIVPINAQEVLSRRVSIDRTTLTLASPIAVSTRPVFPGSNGLSSAVYGGLANIDEAFDAPTTMAPTSSLVDFVPSRPQFIASNPLSWGRLTQLPPQHITARFRTFKEDSLKITFADQAMADRVLKKVSQYGKYPDQRTVDPFYNMIIIGKEIMQYGYATGSIGLSREVTFTNLVRNGQNTDAHYGSHTLGEMCVVADKDTCAYYEVAEGNVGETFKLYSHALGPEQRRYDVLVDETALLPIEPGYILRYDVPPFYSYNPHETRVYFRTRNARWQGFRPDTADQSLSTYGMLGNNSMYLLRTDYDESLFEAERFGTGTSYIIKRYHHSVYSAFNANDPSQYYFFLGKMPTYGGPVITYDVLWDMDTEPLIVVFMAENAHGETRTVYKFPVGDYTQGPTRGLKIL
jgi:hypothetical protein